MKIQISFYPVLFAVAVISLLCDGCGNKEASYDEILELNRRVESAIHAKDPSVEKQFQELQKKIDSVKDESTLARIVIENKTRFSESVLERITDQAMLARIATEAVQRSVSDECIDRIDDPVQLMFVATNQAGRLSEAGGFGSPWTKLIGVESRAVIQIQESLDNPDRRVPSEQLDFVIEWADPDRFDEVEKVYKFALDFLDDDESFQNAVFKRISRLADETAVPDNPVENRKRDKLIALICSRIMKMQNREDATIALAKLAIASKGRMGLEPSDVSSGKGAKRILAKLRQWKSCSKFFSECKNPFELFSPYVFEAEDCRDIAMLHDDPKVRLMAAESESLTGIPLLEVAFKASDQMVREAAILSCRGSDGFKLCDYVSQWDPSYMDSPIEAILIRGRELEPDIPYAEFVKEFDPDFKSKNFKDVVEHGKQLMPIKNAIEGIDFKLRMHSPDSILSGAKAGEAEVVSAFRHIDFSDNQNAYDLGMKLGKFIRRLTELQKICDSEAEEIKSLLEGLPSIDKNTKLGEMMEQTKRKGTDAISSFEKTKKELKEMESDSRDIANTFDRFN